MLIIFKSSIVGWRLTSLLSPPPNDEKKLLGVTISMFGYNTYTALQAGFGRYFLMCYPPLKGLPQ